MKHTPMKRSTWARRPAPSEKELNREQRIAQWTRRAIDSVAEKSAEKKQGNRQTAHAVCAPAAIKKVAKFTRRGVIASVNDAVFTQPKEDVARCEKYRRLVALLPCCHCGIEGYSQAAHGDQGKGLAIKADDRTCYPACAPHDGRQGCHYLIGTSGTYTRKDRQPGPVARWIANVVRPNRIKKKPQHFGRRLGRFSLSRCMADFNLKGPQ